MSQIQSRVSPITKLTAVSSNPSVSGRVYPLSAADHAMARHSAAVVMYYSENPFGSFILDPMRESLSKVLTLYPTVTGRLTRSENGNWAVKGNDAGVRVTMTKVGTTLDEWLRSADSAEERDLAAFEEMPEDPYIWSPFRIQINEFEGGGVAIGVSFTHLTADPTSATFLLKTWADAHRGEPISPPLFTRPSSLGDGKKVPNIATKSTSFYGNKSKLAATDDHIKMSSVTFKFSNTTINQCLSKIKAHCPNATPFDFLAALFWKQILKTKGNLPKNEQNNHSLSICTDIRNSFQSSNSQRYYFGNALRISQLTINSKEMEQSDLGHIVELLHNHLERLGEEEEEIWSTMEWLESRKEKDGKYVAPFKMYGPELSCVSMEHMVMKKGNDESLSYATKFVRDSKPVHVSYNVGNAEGEGLIIVMPSNEGGVARNVMVMLPSNREVAELCKDKVILSFNPTMILGGRANNLN
ncbi:protein ECERIFERUM 26-like [Benincasa hispida]|uniref:protein ECERIFERUM 26-like n=1 Tax=Benincasa hispida TaxID=102211 RepID=UPI0019007AB5|nr:protein ECERIFERUM 26-like [Benincasa hispida]